MRLSELINGDLVRRDTRTASLAASGALEREIAGLTADSRDVKPGYLFAALSGSTLDGRKFITDAVRRGAVAVLTENGTTPVENDIALIADDNPRRRLALMAARFYGRQPETVAAVTGTSGKTSTVEFVRRIWAALGEKSASLGTLGITTDAGSEGPGLTTPDPVALHAALAGLADRGIDHLAMEASSHGLDQFRLDGVKVGVAAFLNLSHEHLDYHRTMADYLKAKAGLFERVLQADGTAVLSADAPQSAELAEIAAERGIRVLTFGRKCGADFRMTDWEATATGQRFSVTHAGHTHAVELPLIGAFQAMNILAATAITVAAGAELERVIGVLAKLEGVRGRMELAAQHPNGAPIFVDYAHKAEALETVLKAIRPHVGGALHIVFGCGGDRDRGKRPIMGRTAIELADHVYVTDDNPRTEDPAAIRAEIMAACPGAAEIGDRAKAIETAIRALGPKDALIVAGKGHETYQIVGTEIRDFDDRDAARAIVSALLGDVR
ncbi:MAG: UDP-N-acetylmuramoyl-L-alanyl-D-glutamate--2,6-diaminopimelate ligase [Nisaea sp.]|uniref:UDP-N-acetylmuramoyl-L-alanyl-D-glutamate--2, 6-diaminopimelate ligase n=1 Tax=Nisaea sp. TaxID=2024842 RepID=UPI001B19DC66|nr:UDP-N-acetylmuramoyl-L-alanyl-D-glutamate--2,6-diaminopimelate ligase [Nisaea sp.]MBO6562048.1 UDP-N-acetylmuramoyl-L-alanyl-D-glutamate--2,6-diaminopimelate ligase [Nisaea sp.]